MTRLESVFKSGYGTPLGVYNDSIMNNINQGAMTTYTKCEGAYEVSNGCPCISMSGIEHGGGSGPIPPGPGAGGVATFFGRQNDTTNGISLASGSEILMGTYTNTIDLYDCSGTIPTVVRFSMTNPFSNVNSSSFIAKYDSSGILLGATKICSEIGNFVVCNKIYSDGASFYVTGSASGKINFYEYGLSDPTNIQATLDPGIGITQYPFIAKYDINTFNVIWTVYATSTSTTVGRDIIISQNNIYWIGHFISSTNFYNANSNISVMTLNPNPGNITNRIFIMKYDLNGQLLWGNYVYNVSGIRSLSITSDNNSNIYISGQPTGTKSIRVYDATGLIEPIFTSPVVTLSGLAGEDVLLVKYDTNGQVIWCNKISSVRNESSLSITYYNLALYITGYYSILTTIYDASGRSDPTSVAMTLSGINASTDIFIIKYDLNGQVLWGNKINTDQAIIPYADNGRSIIVNNTGIYITGFIAGTCNIYDTNGRTDPTNVIFTLSSVNNTRNILLAKYDNNGIIQWATNIGGDTPEVSTFSTGNGLLFDNNNIWLCGQILGSVYFFQGNGRSTPINIPAITYDFGPSNDTIRAVLVKYDSQGQLNI